MVCGERPVSERVKAIEDLGQAAALIAYFLATGELRQIAAAWQDTLSRGRGWERRAQQRDDAPTSADIPISPSAISRRSRARLGQVVLWPIVRRPAVALPPVRCAATARSGERMHHD